MADTLFALRNAGVPQDVITKLTGNKEAMEIFKRCDVLMKADDQLKAEDTAVPKPRQVVTSGGLKWQKADGKWVGGGNKNSAVEKDDKSCDDESSEQKEQQMDKAHAAVKQETTAETAACSSSPSPTLDNTPDVHEPIHKKHSNRSGIPWYATIALVVGAILATFLLTSQTLKAECRSMECPVVKTEFEKVEYLPTTDCDCPGPERVTCPANKVPQQVLDNVRKLQGELLELQAKRSIGEDCPHCPCGSV